MFYINVICIAFICVIITDIFGFFNEITSIISGWMTGGTVKKPFSLRPITCSKCQTFWLGIITMFIMGCVSLPNVLFVLGCSWSTLVIPAFFYFIESVINKFFSDLGNWLNL